MINIMDLANNGNHSILKVIVNYLEHCPNASATEGELKHRLVPPGSNEDKFNMTLRKWTDFGLLQKEKDMISLVPEDLTTLRNDGFRVLVERKLNIHENDFYSDLSWVLAQDLFEISDFDEIDKYIVKNLTTNRSRPFRKKEIWPGFKAWGAFLDYFKVADKVYLDFSSAITRFIKSKLKPGQITYFEFFDELKNYYPFLEGIDICNSLPLTVSLELLDEKNIKLIYLQDGVYCTLHSSKRDVSHILVKKEEN